MAEEIKVGKVEAEITLNNNDLKEKAEETEEILQDIEEQAKKTTSSGASAENSMKATGETAAKAKNSIDEYAEALLRGDKGYTLQGLSELYEQSNKAVSALEQAENALTQANQALEENKGELRTARTEAESYRKEAERLEKLKGTPDFDNDNYEKAIENYKQAQKVVAELETEQTKLRKVVNDAKDAYNKAAEEAAEAAKTLDEKLSELAETAQSLRSEMNSLANSYSQLENGQQLSYGTILDLIAKYPEYTDMLIDAADNADLQRKAIEKLFEAKKNEYILTQQKAIDEIEASNKAAKTELKNIELRIKAMQSLAAALGVKVPEQYFLNQVQDDVTKLLQTIKDGEADIEKFRKNISFVEGLDISGFKNTTNNDTNTKKNPAWTSSYDGEVGSGSTVTEARLDLLDKLETLGKISLETEKKWLSKWLKETGLTYDESYKLRVKLKNAEDKLAEDKAKKEEEKRKNQEDAEKAVADNYLKKIDYLKNLDQISLKSEIASYEYGLKHFKMTADQKQTYEIRLYNARKRLREQEQKEEEERAEKEKQKKQQDIAALDKLGDAVVSALKNKYNQQKELEEKRIDESIKSWQDWEDKTCNAIQGQIDALDELKNAHDEENKREEYENKRQALELQARYEKDDYNRKQLEKQIAALDKAEEERLFNVQIEEQKKALQEQAENVKKISEENRKQLESDKDTISEKYDELMSDMALQEEARKTILKSSQADIVKLINSYAADYELLGTTLGESLYNGMNSKIKDITSYVDTVAKKTDTQAERTAAAANLTSYIASSAQRQTAAKNAAAAGSAVDNIQSVIDKLAASADSISEKVSAYKNQLASVANSAADSYYSTMQNYYSGATNNNAVKNITVNMTVNTDSMSQSPIELKKQFEQISYNLAKEIAAY